MYFRGREVSLNLYMAAHKEAISYEQEHGVMLSEDELVEFVVKYIDERTIKSQDTK